MTAGWTRATADNLSALAAKYGGRAGDDEAETILMWRKDDPTSVEFTSTRGADIARMIRRCGSAVAEFVDFGESVTLRLHQKNREGRKAWRGMEYAFAPLDVESEAWDSKYPKADEEVEP
jgi:hypothetical protein